MEDLAKSVTHMPAPVVVASQAAALMPEPDQHVLALQADLSFMHITSVGHQAFTTKTQFLFGLQSSSHSSSFSSLFNS